MSICTILKKLEKYYEYRSEYIPYAHSYDNLAELHSKTISLLEEQMEEKRKNGDSEIDDQFPIDATNLDSELYNDLTFFGEEFASYLSEFPVDSIQVTQGYVMTNGYTKPFKIEYNIKGEDSSINRTMFLKPFDIIRLIGLEVYNTLGGISRDYSYCFNESVIIEESIEGRHEEDMKGSEIHNLYKNPHFLKEKVKLDVFSLYLGFDDIRKKANYLVTPNGDITLIDFDKAKYNHSNKEIQQIKHETCQELGISQEEYDDYYRECEIELQDRVKRNSHLFDFLEVFKKYGDITIKDTASHITSKLNALMDNKYENPFSENYYGGVSNE